MIAAAASLAMAAAHAQSTVVDVPDEAPPRLRVLPPLPGPLEKGVAYIPYQLENLRVLPIGGVAAKEISPRVGHLHLQLDGLPWQWADYGNSSTIILIGLPAGEHRLRVEAVDPEGRPYTAETLNFSVPKRTP
ncbi:MAG TPA: DUF6130 family protein [Ramlibacter sp.]|nr:DUF6130 family protein [Ramlibacter sp.]